ncbi:L-type lectin-domain containing receptor kinase IV.2-like [Macadamia integrifolia]|uniref:L-type lectin-domain containing receptor kinase IV.2-like n=1 Tax=Macadamia integrifolia TaxID=60698 RepID=UPI001C4E32EB|nr:L-type lectin-domain containing receptor kinase IV.2-like [Macadamia integrifolia]
MKWKTIFFQNVLWFLILSRLIASQQEDLSFTYNGFQGVHISLDSLAHITDNGLLRMANADMEHGGDFRTTNVVGAFSHLAPEFFKTGKANPCWDVFAFGVFLLEVACGRRSVETHASEERFVLVEWVFSSWSTGTILETVDPKLERNYEVEEMELVLKLGLLCSHSIQSTRPSMLQVVRYLEEELPLPELPSQYLGEEVLLDLEFTRNTMSRSTSITNSQLSVGH